MNQIAPPPPASWQAELDKLALRNRIVRRMGSLQRFEHAAGWMTIPGRIERCLRPGSFFGIRSTIGAGDTGPLLREFASMTAPLQTPMGS